MSELLESLLKRIPVFCWAVVCLCLLLYTVTMCYVMLRSKNLSVDVGGVEVNVQQRNFNQSGTPSPSAR